MEHIQSINPKRIEWCCADYGITPDELASELGIASISLKHVMDRQDGMTFNQLKKIAEYFGRGVLFFLEDEPVDDEHVYTLQFRTIANQKTNLYPGIKKLIERAEKQRAVYLSLLEDLAESERVRFSPPELQHKDQQESARITRNWLMLSNKNDFDSYRSALESQGILVFRSNGYNGKWQIPKENPILGFTLYDPVCPMIFIKKLDSEAQQSFTLMHELGHLLLHKTSSIDDEHDLQSHQGRERDVNSFAGYLLVPNNFLADIRDKERPCEVTQFDTWLEPQRKAWGVSGEVILRRLLDVGRLPQSQYIAYRQWRAKLPITQKSGGSREYRYREPKHIFGDTFVRTVLDALNARHITLAKASSYLDSLKIEKLHQLESFYAGF